MDDIFVKGAREHNLKNIDVRIPRNTLTVVTGVSGSGKSSLAFDTIYAEGQRRYVESLSAYARQFLDRLHKPDVDYIEGLSPAISIEQKTAGRNPRSTVGTITEIYDYLRLLFARIGIPHDPKSGKKLERQSVDDIIAHIRGYAEGTKLMLLSPVVRGRKGEHHKILGDAYKAGFTKARIDGKIFPLERVPKLGKQKKHTIEIIIDRIMVSPAQKSRIAESVETALEMSGGLLNVELLDDQRPNTKKSDATDGARSCSRSFSVYYAYEDNDDEVAFPELEPRLFSFNSPQGACSTCSGLGAVLEFDIHKIIPNPKLSFNQGGIVPYNPNANWWRSIFASLAKALDFSLDQPIESISAPIMRQLLSGTKQEVNITYVNESGSLTYSRDRHYLGIVNELRRRYRQTTSDRVKEWLEGFMHYGTCLTCNGMRLRKEALAVKVHSKNIDQISHLTIAEALPLFNPQKFNAKERAICKEVIKEIHQRLSFLQNVGLSYISLNRTAVTLSGGEAQRIRLATQIGSQLVGVLYVLDEPTIGLHQRDNERLLQTLTALRDMGNTLLIVEHDEQTIRRADHIVELGPHAGSHGGQLVISGSIEQINAEPKSLTAQFLNGALAIPLPNERKRGNGNTLHINGARHHNLKKINVDIPLGTLTIICGVSGSGKSSLLSGIVYPLLANTIHNSSHTIGKHDGCSGIEHINKVVQIDQSPIGRTPRSNPATYVGFFTDIRQLFGELPISKARGYKAGRFSFNVSGGRCETCQGAGTLRIEMHFLSDVYVECEACKGTRFNRETLEVTYKGKNIHEVLRMTVDDAQEFFSAIPRVKRHLDMLQAVGLGYITLGQSALTFSGGEAQRIKLSPELARRDTGNTFYILDEPTTGLHHADVMKLINVLHALVNKGNTVVIIEHNLDVIAQADYLIDLGPEGGEGGGYLCTSGTPEQVSKAEGSFTAVYLRQHLDAYS